MSDKICVKPWIHFFAEPSGETRACCVATLFDQDESRSNNLNNHSIEEIYNNANFKRIRKDMMEGRLPKECAVCEKWEQENTDSPRIRQNKKLWDLVNFDEALKNTKEDGTLKKIEFHEIDIRTTNHCNLKCRTCNHDLSSSWFKDSKELNRKTPVNTAIFTFDKENKFFDEIRPYIENLKIAYFAGGEPLLSPFHKRLTDYLYESKKDIRIDYTTNLSLPIYKNQDQLIEKWKSFSEIFIILSLDEIGKRGELLRSGLDFDLVLKNVRKLRELNNIQLYVQCTVQLSNIFNLPSIIDFIIDENIVDEPGKIILFPLEYPQYLNITYMPENVKKEVSENLQNYLIQKEKDFSERAQKMAVNTEFETLKNQILNIIHFLNNSNPENKDEMIDKHFGFMHKLDILRDDDYKTLFPDVFRKLKD